MASAITGRITLNLVAGIVITVATVLTTLFWMAAKHDEQAAQGTQTMVEGGVQAMGKRLAQLAISARLMDASSYAYSTTPILVRRRSTKPPG